MLLISLFVVFLSPFTAFSVTAVTLPKITRFTFTISEFSNNRGKRLQLTCIVEGTPTPRIEFQKNGVILKNASNIDRISAQVVHISNVTYQNDDGMYQCVATNVHGKVFSEKKIKIPTLGKFLPENEFSKPPYYEPVRVNAGKRLHCPRHTHAYPVQYIWGFKIPRTSNFKLFRQSRLRHYLNNGKVLFLSMVTEEDIKTIRDNGGISCYLKVKGDIVPSRRYILTNSGNPITADLRPHVYGHLDRNNYVINNKPLTLHCAASGLPIPSVKWYKNGVEINVNDSTKYGVSVTLPGRLTLREVTKDMEGQYKCLFTNRAGTAFSKTNVIVAELPEISPLPDSMNTYNGSKMRLVCNVTGTGPFNYTWYRNGSQLSSYTHKNYSMKVKENVLEINAMRYEDAGTYQCYAKSKYGQVSSATKVVVKAPRPAENRGRNDNKRTNSDTSSGGGLELKYIIIIACTSAVVLVLACGGMFLYCRTKKDKEQEQFIPTPKPPYNEYNSQRNKTRYERADQYDGKPIYDFPHPPKNLTDSDDDMDGMSTFKGGARMNSETLELINTLKSDSSDTSARSEHFYYDIPEDGKASVTPSTEL